MLCKATKKGMRNLKKITADITEKGGSKYYSKTVKYADK